MREKTRKKILDNFYTKEIKKGKSQRAYVMDKISVWIIMYLAMFFTINFIIKHILISIILSLGIIIYLATLYNKHYIKRKNLKIQEIKCSLKERLLEEDVLSEEDNIEDYIVMNYYEKKKEFKSNIDIYAKGKAFKLYILSIMFFIGSYFIQYNIYYKIMAVICFCAGSFISSRKFIDYIRQKNNNSLLD